MRRCESGWLRRRTTRCSDPLWKRKGSRVGQGAAKAGKPSSRRVGSQSTLVWSEGCNFAVASGAGSRVLHPRSAAQEPRLLCGSQALDAGPGANDLDTSPCRRGSAPWLDGPRSDYDGPSTHLR
jgi:hypothetical protein